MCWAPPWHLPTSLCTAHMLHPDFPDSGPALPCSHRVAWSRPGRTCQVTGILLTGAVHLALVAGQHLLHQIQHAKILHDVIEEHGV